MGSFVRGSFVAMDSFEEGDHPRDGGGKFTSGGGSGGGSSEEHAKHIGEADSYEEAEKRINEATAKMSVAEMSEFAQKHFHMPAGYKKTKADLRTHMAKTWLQRKRFENKIAKDPEVEKAHAELRDKAANDPAWKTKILGKDSKDTSSLGQQLRAASKDRARFDSMLNQLASSCTLKELKEIAKAYTGYDPSENTKGAIVKRMLTWQREEEMNDALHGAQAKHKP